MSEIRLVAMTRAQANHVRWLAETARRLSVDPRSKNPEKFRADSEAALVLADAFDAGITEEEARVISDCAAEVDTRLDPEGYLSRKLTDPFEDSPDE